MSTREHETQGTGAEPPVIDLDAEEVAGAETATPNEPKPDLDEPPSPTPRKTFPVRTIATTVLIVAAVAAGALGYRSFGERFWPSDRMLAIEEDVSALDSATRTLNSQIAALGLAVDELKTAGAGMSGRVDEALAGTKAIDERLAAAEAALKSTRDAITALRSPGTDGGSGTGVPSAERDALAGRVAALESALANLKRDEALTGEGSPESATLSQALADLKAKLASGAPYEAEAQTIARLVPGISGLDRLTPYAASGLPTAQGLAVEIEAAAAGLTPPERTNVQTADSGYFAGIGDFLGSIVTVRRIGEADWRQMSAAVASDAKSGNLAAAIARLDDSEAALPPPIEQWRNMAKARINADAAVEELSVAVLRVLSSSKS